MCKWLFSLSYHSLCCSSLQAATKFLSILWKHHSLHHYRSDNSAFSVSNPMWDYIFGTMPDKKSIQKGDKEKLPDSL
ncbi:MAG: sterol desaturase family protein [Bacteroidota bacterium]|nr:MAG: sterol desaturase family protein [Bacteroidota bacterium]